MLMICLFCLPKLKKILLYQLAALFYLKFLAKGMNHCTSVVTTI